jgi:hypothetical protein
MTLVFIWQITRHNTPEDCILNIHHAENLKAVFFVFGVNTWNAAQNVFQVLSSINTGHGDDDND